MIIKVTGKFIKDILERINFRNEWDFSQLYFNKARKKKRMQGELREWYPGTYRFLDTWRKEKRKTTGSFKRQQVWYKILTFTVKRILIENYTI